MRTIYCVAFDPDTKADGSVGGVDWYAQPEAAHQRYAELLADPDYNNDRLTLFDLKVPANASSDELTDLADGAAWGEFYRPIKRREPVPAEV